MAGDFPIPLHSMHVTHHDACSRHLNWSNNDGPLTHVVNVHVSIGALGLIRFGDGQLKRGVYQENGKVSSVMRAWHIDGGDGPYISYHWPNSGYDSRRKIGQT